MDHSPVEYEPIFSEKRKEAATVANTAANEHGNKSFTSDLFPPPKSVGLFGQSPQQTATFDQAPDPVQNLSFEQLRQKLDISYQTKSENAKNSTSSVNSKKSIDLSQSENKNEGSKEERNEVRKEVIAEHTLGFSFLANWSDYFAQVKDLFIVDGQSLNALSRQDDYRGGKVKVLFLGDTFALSEQEGEEDLLARMINAMKLERGEYSRLFYDPDFAEESYFHAFFQEIQLYEPDYVVSMGATITNLLLRKQSRLSKVHGNFTKVLLRDSNSQVREFEMMPIFHPEYLKVNPSMKKNTWEDLQKLMKRLGKC